jgi:hypothetical protein
VLVQRVRLAMAGIVVTEMLSELCLKPARDTGEKLKTSSRHFQAEPRWIPIAAEPRQPGLGVYEVSTTLLPLLLHYARSCCRKKSWRGAHLRAFLDCRGSSVGRVPKAWFDIWGLRPGLYFNVEDYDVALPECGIAVIGVAVGASNL